MDRASLVGVCVLMCVGVCSGMLERRWIESFPSMRFCPFFPHVQKVLSRLATLTYPMFSDIALLSSSLQVGTWDWMVSTHFLLHILCVDDGLVPQTQAHLDLVQPYPETASKIGCVSVLFDWTQKSRRRQDSNGILPFPTSIFQTDPLPFLRGRACECRGGISHQ